MLIIVRLVNLGIIILDLQIGPSAQCQLVIDIIAKSLYVPSSKSYSTLTFTDNIDVIITTVA